MRSSQLFAFGSLAILAAAAAPIACGSGGTNGNGTSGSGASHGTGTHAGAGGNGEGGSLFDGGQDPVVSVVITPADPTIEILDGATVAPITFTAKGKTKGGAMVDLTGDWSFDRLDVASMNPGNGTLTPSGLVGGKGTVSFKSGTDVGSTTATVKLHFTYDPQAIDPSIKTQFGQASADDGAMTLLYPYDKTVFPRGLTGPTIQWNGGAANDIYYLHAQSPTFEYEAWGAVPPPSRFDLPADIWRKLTDSTSGDITVSLQRHDGSQPYKPVTRTWTIAPANLTGTVYFWEVNSGNVVRLKPGDTGPQDFLQKPGGVSCVACHSVSKNGSTLVASFNGGQSPWGSFDAATGASLYNSGQNSGFQAISPDGQFVLTRHWIDGGFSSDGHLSLSKFNDGTELAQLATGAGAPAYPAWSGDGKRIALANRTDGNGLDFTQATLWMADVDVGTASFANIHQIVQNDATRPAVIYPTFSPDSQWIAFERSTQARSRGAQADIWLTSPDGTTQIALDQANGAGLLAGAEASSTYEPTFMPVAAGGYFWLIVVSERTYGNTLTDTNTNTRHKQLWVTAIDAAPTAGKDPSHPAFWLPGQDLGNNNMRGEWALSPCKMLGETCSAGYDCCDGFCHDDGSGNLTCSNTGGGCSQMGEKCTVATDCCDPALSCIGGFCASNIPG